MPRTLLLVGTRKGCFLLESDADRRDWEVRGPFCEGWPVYHAIHDASSGALYAAAASEGLAYDDGNGGERKLSKVSNLAATDGRLLVGVEAPGIFESRDGGENWS